MQIKGQDARSIGVYKGRELLDRGIWEKKMKEKRLEQEQQEERERAVYIPV